MREAACTAVAVALGMAACGPSVADQFKRAEGRGTVDAWRAFIATHPGAPQIEEARRRMDEACFRRATEGGTVEAYDAYLDEFPEGGHAQDALDTQDDLTFEQAREDGRYDAYLERYPEGRHVQEARDRWVETELSRAEAEGLEALREVLERYPRSKHVPEGWRQLEKALVEEAGEAGAILWRVREDGVLRGVRAVAGYAGGRAFALRRVDLGLGERPLVPRKGKVRIEGTIRFDLVGDYPEEPVSVVVLLRSDEAERLLTQTIRLKKKKVERKRAGKARVALSGSTGELPSGGRAFVFLVSGEVGTDVQALEPVSSIVAGDFAIETEAP